MYPVDRFEAVLQPCDDRPDGAGLMMRVVIVRDDRRGLCDAIALGDPDVEALEPGLLGRSSELFPALYEKAHRREVIVVACGFRVAGEEGIRGEEQRYTFVVTDGGDRLIVQRRRVEIDEEAQRYGHEYAAESEGVEDRHRVEDAVRTVEVDAREHLRVVCVEVFIAEDHALGRSL